MKTKLIKFSVLTIFTLFLLNSCGWYKRSDIKDNPVNVDERVKKIFKKEGVLDLEVVLLVVEILISLLQIHFGGVQLML